MYDKKITLIRSLLILAGCLSLAQIPCQAQLGGIDAEFAGAGARAMAMGGSFLALGDDATASEFNPAGLQILRRPEIAWQMAYSFDQRNEYFPLSEQRDMDRNEWFTPSFVSYVHPGEKWTWAISQLTNINFDHKFSDSNSSGSRKRNYHTEAMNNAIGITFARDLAPRLHIGATMRMNKFSYRYEEIRQNNDITGSTLVDFSDWAPSFNLGLLWRASKKWSFGTVYKSNQEVSLNEPGNSFTTHLPQTFGVGVAYHPNDKLRLLADIDRITWTDFDSRMDDEFIRDDVTRMHVGGEYLFHLEEERA